MQKPIQILLVDGYTNTRLFMTRLLMKAGFEITGAASKAEALRLCRGNYFDVLVSDLSLPGGHDMQLLLEIRKLYPITAIACSGIDEERERCLSGGFDAYFCNPIHVRHLLKTLAGPVVEIPFFLAPCITYRGYTINA